MRIITHLFSYPLLLIFLHLISHKGLEVGFLICLLPVLLPFHQQITSANSSFYVILPYKVGMLSEIDWLCKSRVVFKK